MYPAMWGALPAPPVGQVIPVYIEVVGAGSEAGIYATYREDISALDTGGNYVETLDFNEAAEMAGGIDQLAEAVARDESAIDAIGRSFLEPTAKGVAGGLKLGQGADFYGLLGSLAAGTAAGMGSGVARGTYVAAVPHARAMDQVELYSLGSRSTWYWHNEPGKGFVYFPKRDYVGLRIAVEKGETVDFQSIPSPRRSEQTATSRAKAEESNR